MLKKKVKNPKILIISSEEDTNFKAITEWLMHYKADFFCINTYKDTVSIHDYDMQTQALSLLIEENEKEYILNFKKLQTVFIRNGILNFKINPVSNNSIKDSILDYIHYYERSLNEFLEYHFCTKYNVIGLWGDAFINKLIVLEQAKKIGFKIPDTYLKTEMNTLNDETSYISKTLAAPLITESETQKFLTYTARLDKLLFPEKIMTSLIQKEIKKLFEIRVFVFLKKVYAMAIFSQMNKESVVDYRVYNNDKPYLDEPYIIPNSLKEKLFNLMDVLKLNTGSFDFMYTESGEYYFLEVNPVGQFGYLGKVCGVDLNKVIAEEIIDL
ncbi:hypothetical protein CXF68_07395 [Tenacibaculum sp. Bg11-29]|uniref:hypothetical protein n=1 Tax=Tenacibaculum sp. Bg11-29 TaxID=2058306 RepID=UPI000C329FCC|nr:hypothetical protein [Tenacibaculum sp. Bg11-29]PKH50530.1 hypothetical protein CXF68_07395 [Tenacibaculum sp. Bg11-29]